LIGVVSITMLFSGFMLFSGSPPPIESPIELLNLSEYVDAYNVADLGSVVVNISKVSNKLTIIPEYSCISSRLISQFENLSLSNITRKTYEVANPQQTNQKEFVCANSYLFINLFLEDNVSNISNDNLEIIRGVIGKYTIYGNFVGEPLQSVSFVDKIPFIADLHAKVGDCYDVSLLRKYEGRTELGFIGLIRSSVFKGSLVPAEVIDIYGLSINGLFPSNLSEKDVNLSGVQSIRIQKPKIISDKPIDVGNLSGVETTFVGNETHISFNDSRDLLLTLLSNENITLEEGKIHLMTSTETNISEIRDILTGLDVFNISFNNVGFVSVPHVVVIEGNLISIENNENLESLLELNTSIGEKINVRLTTLTTGDQVFIVGSEEVYSG